LERREIRETKEKNPSEEKELTKVFYPFKKASVELTKERVPRVWEGRRYVELYRNKRVGIGRRITVGDS